MADAKAATADGEAEVEDGAEGGAGQGKKKFSLPPTKFLIIGGAAFLALVAVGGGGYWFLAKKPAPKVEENAVKPTVFVDLPEVLVNLSNTGSERTQYLKVKIVLEVAEQKVVTQITPIMPRVMDAFQTYLRELRPSDLEGSAGLYRLKEELTRRVNASIAPNRINAVLFKEIVVQ
jgi:flagellar protein FliL